MDAIRLAHQLGMPTRGPDSIPALFPHFASVNDILRRHKRKSNPSVPLPFDIPAVYQSTFRGNIDKSHDRFVAIFDH